MEKFVDAIVEAFHDDLENQRKDMRIKLPGEEGKDNGTLSKEFEARTREMNGTQLILVLEKYLFQTNIISIENQLSIPLNQMRKGFLKKKENVRVQAKGMEVQLLRPSSEVCKITNVLKARSVNFEA